MTPDFPKLTKGCYGRQRNGDKVGPLKQNPKTGMITARNDEWDYWHPTGAFSPHEETPFDIIEIIPTLDCQPPQKKDT